MAFSMPMGFNMRIRHVGVAVGLTALLVGGWQPLTAASTDHLFQLMMNWETHPFIADVFLLEAENPRLVHLVGKNFGARAEDVQVKLVGPPVDITNAANLTLGGVGTTTAKLRADRALSFIWVNAHHLAFAVPADAGVDPKVVVSVKGVESLPEGLRELPTYYSGQDLVREVSPEPVFRLQAPAYVFSQGERTRHIQQIVRQQLFFNDYNAMVRKAFDLKAAEDPLPRAGAPERHRRPRLSRLVQFHHEPRTEFHLIGEDLHGRVEIFSIWPNSGCTIAKKETLNNNHIRFSGPTEGDPIYRVRVQGGDIADWAQVGSRWELLCELDCRGSQALRVANPFQLLAVQALDGKGPRVLDPKALEWNNQVIAAFQLKKEDVAAHLGGQSKAGSGGSGGMSGIAAAANAGASPQAPVAPTYDAAPAAAPAPGKTWSGSMGAAPSGAAGGGKGAARPFTPSDYLKDDKDLN